MKIRMKGTWILLFILILCCGMSYVGLSLYYRDNFAANTWINGLYCTGRNVQDVNGELLGQTETPESFTVRGYAREGRDIVVSEWTVSMEELQFALSYEEELQDCFEAQDPWLWIGNLFGRKEHFVEAVVSYDEQSLRDWWQPIADSLRAEAEYRIEYVEDEGYVLHDGLHDRLDGDKAWQMISGALAEGLSHVDLIVGECYYDESFSEEQREQVLLWERIEHFQGNGPVYDFGEGALQLDRACMAGFMEKDETSMMPLWDEDGHPVLKKGAAGEWLKEMAELHDTYGKTWDFQSTRGDVVQVQGVNYGTTINQKRELVWFSDYLERLAAGEEMHEDARVPEYSREAFCRRCEDVGGTYIEVDLGIQKLYYYEDGALRLETDVVSGDTKRRRSTPEGVNYVYSKQKNRVLRGRDYVTPVKFWMPVDGAIGIHDSDWRDEFGGDIYETDGSHGCVNVPPEVMAELYDMTEIGTPVVMFYGEEPGDGA